MTEPGSISEEARRLAEAFTDWTHEHSDGLVAGAGTSEQCRYCPLCQLIAVLRGDRPEVSARVLESGTAFLQALRSILAPDDAVPPREQQPPPAPPVQHIDLR